MLYKGSVTDSSAVDYLQYGAKPDSDLTHAAVSADTALWDGNYNYALAGAAGKFLEAKTKGAAGSTDWELK